MTKAQLEFAIGSVDELLEDASERLHNTGDYPSEELDEACTLLDKVRVKIDTFKTKALNG